MASCSSVGVAHLPHAADIRRRLMEQRRITMHTYGWQRRGGQGSGVLAKRNLVVLR
jgi:hypothetical protein